MRQASSNHAALLVGCSIAAVTGGQAVAQTSDAGEAVEDVVVMGWRVIRDSLQAPPPLTVLDAKAHLIRWVETLLGGSPSPSVSVCDL
jgi:hypothetical protein